MRLAKGPSDNLSWVELACHDGTPYPEQWRLSRAIPLSKAFEAVRALLGGPIMISSGYRTPAYNKAIGGARFSQHVEGRALDLHPGRRPLEALQDACERVREDGLITGIGYYHDFVHIDIRPGKNVTWYGSRRNSDNDAG